MRVNLKALLFASAATLALSAVSVPAFAADGPTAYDKQQDQTSYDKWAGQYDTNNKLNDAIKRRKDKDKDQDFGITQNALNIDQNQTDIAQNKTDIVKAQSTADTANATANGAKAMTIANQRDIADNRQGVIDATTGKAWDNQARTAAGNAQSAANAAQGDATAALSGDANDRVARSKAQDAQKDATRALTGQANDEMARDGVAANAQRIYEANQNIARTSAADRSYTDQTAAKTLASANAYTDSRYNQLDGKVKKLRARVDSGVAGATAIGTLAFDSLKANSIAGGLSVAKNKVAGAVGYQHNFNENWRARGTLAVSDNYVQGGASVGYSW